MMWLKTLWLLSCAFCALVQAAMELPKLNQMKLLYPGYYLHGGKYRDREIIKMIGGNRTHAMDHLHNTASIRMSWTLNKYGGRHSLGKEPVFLSTKGRDSYTGQNGEEFIFRNTAFGPFLAAKYGNPIVAKPNKHNATQTMDSFKNKQGIVRLVSYHRKHPGGHIALWDCDHFFQSRDWTTELHLISVEFWETPDSYCPPNLDDTPPIPHLQVVDTGKVHVIPRHNLHLQDFQVSHRRRQGALPKQLRLRHHGRHRSNRDILWSQ